MPDIFNPSNTQPASSTPDPTPREVTSHRHPFAAFCQDPIGVRFQNQEGNEHIHLLLRRHVVTNIPWIFFTILLILIPLLLFFVLNSQIAGITNVLPGRFTLVLLLFYILIVFVYGFISFITWFYNISLVTKARVIDIDFSDVVYHNVAATTISRIADVTYEQTGFIRSLFNYGDVYLKIEGPAENKDFDLLAVPKPAQVETIIENLLEQGPGPS